MDDRDLDDAELWAVIDSAAAAAVSSRSRKPLISPIPAPFFSPVPPKPFRNPRQQQQQQQQQEIRVTAIGEVVQEDHRWDHYHRPQKEARVADSHGDNRMVVRQSPRTPTVSSISYSSPPDFSRGFSVKNVSPVVERPPPDHWKAEEENLRHSLSGQFPSVSLFKQYQNAAMAILEKTDYTMISGTPFIKKSGWRKISFFFNISFEIKDKSIEFDESRNVQRAEFLVRAYMQGGRFSDGWGSCERREKRFQKPNHDIPSTAETRAKNKACQDLLGIGEYRPGANNVPS